MRIHKQCRDNFAHRDSVGPTSGCWRTQISKKVVNNFDSEKRSQRQHEVLLRAEGEDSLRGLNSLPAVALDFTPQAT